MKKILIFVSALSVAISGFSQVNQTDLARVKKINGVEAYVMCEPLRDYETVTDAGTGFKAESVASGGVFNKSISGRIEQFIKRAKKENENFDAIVYTSGKRVVSVRFTDKPTQATKGIGRATKMKGMPVFVMCEPVTPYEYLQSRGGGVKWKSAMTGGIINNSIEEDVEKIVSKLNGVRGVEAFLFDGTKEGDAIRFKK